ncbi:MAG TPA: TIGR00375 family protein [Thermoanaerobacterales bacterium]|nr:TIGR00375 family protein [Thermoanaerobacterales bacterium]
MEYFADLHVHIGTAKNRPVKITASRQLTIKNIFNACLTMKGIDIIGIVDCASPPVIDEIKELIKKGELKELKGGGLSYREKITVILGAEIETSEDAGAAHVVAFFPYFQQMCEFSMAMASHITNIYLSSQRAHLNAYQLLDIVNGLGGKLIPAHIFTPFKSFYGNCYDRLYHAFKEKYDQISAVELGLSSDTDFADTIGELSSKTFLSNSDAHSIEKIAREYNRLSLKAPDFENLFDALIANGNNDNYVVANYGIDPRLGKYHRTRCLKCGYIAEEKPPVLECPCCHSKDIVPGVLDRITIISDYKHPVHPAGRPPYIYQIPLEFIPGLGKKSLKKLIDVFGSEMNVLQFAEEQELANVVGETIARKIILSRQGLLHLKAGGGGHYGKIIM